MDGLRNQGNSTKAGCWNRYWDEYFHDSMNWRELPWGEQRAVGMAAAVVKSLAGSVTSPVLSCLICLFHPPDPKGFETHTKGLQHQKNMQKLEELKKKLSVYFMHLRRRCEGIDVFDNGLVLEMELLLGGAGLVLVPETERKPGQEYFCKLCKVGFNASSKLFHVLGQRHLRACCIHVDTKCLQLQLSRLNSLEQEALAAAGGWSLSTLSEQLVPPRPPPTWNNPQSLILPITPKPATIVREPSPPGTSSITIPAIPGMTGNNHAPQASSSTSPMPDPRLKSRQAPIITPNPLPQQPALPAGFTPRYSLTPHPFVSRPASSVRAAPAPLPSTAVPRNHRNAALGATAAATFPLVSNPQIFQSSRWDAFWGQAQIPGFGDHSQTLFNLRGMPPPRRVHAFDSLFPTTSYQEGPPTSQNAPGGSEFSTFFSTTDDGTTPVPPIEKISSKNAKRQKLQSSSSAASKPFPFLAFDEIIGFVFPQEAAEALDLLLKKPQEYEVEKYVQAECQLQGRTFTATGRTEVEAKNKLALQVLMFLKSDTAAPSNAQA